LEIVVTALSVRIFLFELATWKVQAILDESANRRGQRSAAGGAADSAEPLLSGAEAALLMKIGVRVVRGPDWKWSDQVPRFTQRYPILPSFPYFYPILPDFT